MNGWRRSAARALLRVWRTWPKPVRRFVVRRAMPGYTLGAMAIVQDGDGRVLAVRQSYADEWTLPGGFLKRGEQPDVAAVREIGEEVGLRVRVAGEAIAVVDPVKLKIHLTYPVDVDGDPADARPVSAEIDEVRWVDPAAAGWLTEEAAETLRRWLTRA